MQTWIALIRAIGGGTHKVMPLSDLRAAAIDAGLQDVQGALATGNFIFTSERSPGDIARIWERVVAGFGQRCAVFLHRPSELKALLAANPFPDAAERRHNHLLVLFMTEPAAETSLADYVGPERISVAPREVFIDYAENVGTSRLTPARLERGLGHPGTACSRNTINRLIDKAG